MRVQGTDEFLVPLSHKRAEELFDYCLGDLAVFTDGGNAVDIEVNAAHLYGGPGMYTNE